MADIQTRIRDEVEEQHAVIQAWLSGAMARDEAEFGRRFVDRLSEGFVIIPPGGAPASREDVVADLRSAHGASPGFRIGIRNVVVHEARDGLVVATYEEHQRGARNAIAPDNARRSTVVFVDEPTADGALRWRLLHETWFPAEEMAAQPYDF